MTDEEELSRLLFAAREQIEMWADVVERQIGGPAPDVRRVLADIDAYRQRRGWSPHGFGWESAGRPPGSLQGRGSAPVTTDG